MAIDTTSPRTRRAVLAGVLGGVGVLLAEALGRPLGVRGADGDVVHVGDVLTGTRTTSITTSRGYGIRGISTSTRTAADQEAGVFGHATATSGPTAGVAGRSDSNAGTGIVGVASAASGVTMGVSGMTFSPEGTGVAGIARASSGATNGVYGSSESTEGTGVLGAATAPSGATNGVFGQSASTAGVGVVGLATASSGQTFGLYGESASSDGWGCLAVATAEGGRTVGVAGSSASGGGTGVLGWSRGDATGVQGYSGPEPRPDAPSMTGVYGVAAQEGGRGGVFSGSAAQLRLLPASSARPDSGQLGDLFLDAEGSLWFCKGGEDWKQLA
jgi:hypothetical protein